MRLKSYGILYFNHMVFCVNQLICCSFQSGRKLHHLLRKLKHKCRGVCLHLFWVPDIKRQKEEEEGDFVEVTKGPGVGDPPTSFHSLIVFLHEKDVVGPFFNTCDSFAKAVYFYFFIFLHRGRVQRQLFSAVSPPAC